MKGPIQSVEVSYILHATEDAEKMGAAVTDLMGDGFSPEMEEMQGHFGNRIVRVRYSVTGGDASEVFVRIARNLSPQTRDELSGRIGQFIDEHSALFLRFDKQSLVSKGSLDPGKEDPLRVRIKPRGYLLRGPASDFYSKFFQENK